MVTQLNKEQYLSTMGNKMNNVTKSAQALVDIWDYAKELLEKHLISEYGFSKRCIEAVYENEENTYQHKLMTRIKDDFKKVQYYQKELESLEKRINRYKDNLNQENASRLHIAIGLKILSVILIKYQLGYEIDEIKQDVLTYIENAKLVVRYSGGNMVYDDVANLLSLAYLFDVDLKQVEFIKTYMVPEKDIDIRLDIIRNAYFEGKCYSSKDFYYRDKGYLGDFSKENGGIVDVYNAPDAERTDLFLKHLNTVKDKHHRKLVKYYETLAEDRYTYTGATDIVLTAVAKALELDKSALCDSKYIAFDLL